MSQELDQETAIRPTDVQGMMMGAWEQGTKLELGGGYQAVCLDGEVWEIQTARQEPVATIDPTQAVSCRKVVREVERVISKGRRYNQGFYASAGGGPD